MSPIHQESIVVNFSEQNYEVDTVIMLIIHIKERKCKRLNLFKMPNSMTGCHKSSKKKQVKKRVELKEHIFLILPVDSHRKLEAIYAVFPATH